MVPFHPVFLMKSSTFQEMVSFASHLGRHAMSLGTILVQHGNVVLAKKMKMYKIKCQENLDPDMVQWYRHDPSSYKVEGYCFKGYF